MGAGIRPVSYLSEASKNSGNLLMDITRGNNPYETVTEMAIGILGQNNKPVGLIHYHKGEKPRTSKKVRQDSPVLIGTFNLGLQPVAVTL